jgi:hypothetical protein
VQRHGLIAGATGTGKTKTLQLMAEQLSAMGVLVFAADVKGDLSGLLLPGEASDRGVVTRLGARHRVDAGRASGLVPVARRAGHRRAGAGCDAVVRPLASLMAAVPDATMTTVARASPLWAKYPEEIDPESAREKLTAKLAAAAEPTAGPAPMPDAPAEAGAHNAGGRKRAKARARPKADDDGNAITDFLKTREGRARVNNAVRGAMGVLKGFMK